MTAQDDIRAAMQAIEKCQPYAKAGMEMETLNDCQNVLAKMFGRY